ncbi:hypothetical protein [Yoonia sp. BS5-3]|uniref:Outer membrane lipoprotein carrier protein LolA n=1 Tax=Yoonia phaeophyticola TaxID=3137369 RepID=A0ABZ2UYT8_9RHOB
MKSIQTICGIAAVMLAPVALTAQETVPDISGEITTTAQAIQFAYEVVGVPDTPTMRIAEMKTQFSAKGNRWDIDFRDGELTYDVTIRQDRDFDLDRDIEEEGDIPSFWENQPPIPDAPMPEALFEQASGILTQFNANYRPTGRALIEFETCDLPALDRPSEYENGCRRDRPSYENVVFVEIVATIRGEERTFFKAVTISDEGLPTELTDASVSGNW